MKEIILEKLIRVLSEGRVDDVKKKYPELIDATGESPIIDYFVANDPSGNNKYLDWMAKAMTHKPTISMVGDILGDHEYEERGIWGNTAAFIKMLVEKFHDLTPYLIHTENGVKEGTTDLYQYKFTDSETINYLIFDIDQAEERKKKKEEAEKANKADRIYKDSNWVVVRPKTWEASCKFGAGTKWCTTSKTSSSHFRRETENNFLIYVINKNLPDTDPLYKVAWQIAYKKNYSKLKKIISDPNSELESGLNLWNAEDDNIARFNFANPKGGRFYLNTVPDSIKENITNYIQQQMDEKFADLGFIENPKIQALVEHLGLNQDQADEVELVTDYYGMDVYDYNGNEYGIGDWDDVSSALNGRAFSYIEDVGVAETLVGMNWPGSFITIDDSYRIAYDYVQNRMDETSDEELLDIAKLHDYGSLVEEINILQGMYHDDSDMDDLENELQTGKISREEYLSEVEKLEKEKNEIDEDITKKILYLRRKVFDDLVYEEEQQIFDQPISWLTDMGWWDKRNPKIVQEAIDRGIFSVDIPQMASVMSDSMSIYDLGEYKEVTVGTSVYYIIFM